MDAVNGKYGRGTLRRAKVLAEKFVVSGALPPPQKLRRAATTVLWRWLLPRPLRAGRYEPGVKRALHYDAGPLDFEPLLAAADSD